MSPQGFYSESVWARFVGCWFQALWADATAASDAAGHPYMNRDGQLVNPKPPGKFETHLRRYCSEILNVPFPV